MNMSLIAGGYLAAIIMGWLWLQARDDLAASVAECNQRIESAARQSSELARAAERAANAARLIEMERLMEEADAARLRAEAARVEAEARPPVIREVIRKVADTDACITTNLPAELVGSLRGD